jgi:hypothetical protein
LDNRKLNFIPRSLAELDEDVVVDFMLPLKGSRVLYADYRQVVEDFPWLAGDLKLCGERETPADQRKIDDWLLHNCSIMSIAQLQETANSDISEPKSVAYRPPRYGRACIVETKSRHGGRTGLLDIKGCGVDLSCKPSPQRHMTGTLSVSEAFTEVAKQIIIEKVMKTYGLKISGVPVYAIIDLGLEGVDQFSLKPCRLANVVRRAHQRPRGNIELAQFRSNTQRAQLFTELILRTFGISCTFGNQFSIWKSDGGYQYDVMPSKPNQLLLTSDHLKLLVNDANLGLPAKIGFVNVQLTRNHSFNPTEVELIDFGHYVFMDRFHGALLSTVKNVDMNWGGLLKDTDADWVQPIQSMALDHKKFLESSPEDGKNRKGRPESFFDLGERLELEAAKPVVSREYISHELDKFVFFHDEKNCPEKDSTEIVRKTTELVNRIVLSDLPSCLKMRE